MCNAVNSIIDVKTLCAIDSFNLDMCFVQNIKWLLKKKLFRAPICNIIQQTLTFDFLLIHIFFNYNFLDIH